MHGFLIYSIHQGSNLDGYHIGYYKKTKLGNRILDTNRILEFNQLNKTIYLYCDTNYPQVNNPTVEYLSQTKCFSMTYIGKLDISPPDITVFILVIKRIKSFFY